MSSVRPKGVWGLSYTAWVWKSEKRIKRVGFGPFVGFVDTKKNTEQHQSHPLKQVSNLPASIRSCFLRILKKKKHSYPVSSSNHNDVVFKPLQAEYRTKLLVYLDDFFGEGNKRVIYHQWVGLHIGAVFLTSCTLILTHTVNTAAQSISQILPLVLLLSWLWLYVPAWRTACVYVCTSTWRWWPPMALNPQWL